MPEGPGHHPRTPLLAPLPPQLQQLQVKMHLWFLPQVQKLLNQTALLLKLLLPLQCLKVQATLWEVVLHLQEEQQENPKMILRRSGGGGLHSLIKWPKSRKRKSKDSNFTAFPCIAFLLTCNKCTSIYSRPPVFIDTFFLTSCLSYLSPSVLTSKSRRPSVTLLSVS